MFKRRRIGVTNYRKRLALLKSNKPRLVVRKSNKHIKVQFIEYNPKGDRVICEANSKELSHVFPERANIPTAYLTSLLASKRALKKGVKEFVLDIGLTRPSKNNFCFVAAKAALDAGLSSNFGSEVDEKRIKGEHIKNYALLLKKQDPEKYKRQFSEYLKQNFLPEEIDKVFEEARKKVLEWNGSQKQK
ncbi:MAG: 50S ribosomal protein L18 [Candidatus Micrarchaeia archaeon]